jgi:hypothetical protein
LAVSGGIHLIAQAPQRWPKYIHGTRRFVMQRFPSLSFTLTIRN